MSRVRRRRLLSGVLASGLLLSAGCNVNSDTVTSLVDLTSMTAGGLVQIAVKAIINGLLAAATPPDPTAPISEQHH